MTHRHVTPPVRIAVVGCGAIAERFHLPALCANPATRAGIVLVDSQRARLDAMSARFSIAATATDYQELPLDVDGAIVATPPATHAAVARYFLARGIHVLCEKPLADSAADAKAMVEAARAGGATLAVNHTRRLFPTYAAIARLLADGELGRLLRIEYHEGCDFDWPAASPFHFALGARGVLSDVGIHILDVLCWWLGGKPTLVASRSDAAGGPEALAALRLAHDGCELEVVVSRLGRLANRFRIVGSRGAIEAGHEDWAEVEIRYRDGRRRRLRPRSAARSYADFATPLIENFVDVIARGAAPIVSGDSALAALELVDEAYERSAPLDAPWNDRLAEPAPIRSTTPQRVLVTGASGFVGARVVETLAATGEAIPLAAVRQWARAARAARFGVETRVFDVLDPAAAERALVDCDAVVHCAYAGDPHSIVAGTQSVVEASLAAGVRRLVYLSSAEVYGDAAGTLDESAPTPLAGRPYGDAKIEAERICRAATARGLHVGILRPSIVYGPGSRSWTINLAKRLLSGAWGAFEQFGDGAANLVYVDDLVAAIRLAVTADAPSGEAFNLGGPDRVTWNEYFRRFNAALGLPPLATLAATRSRWRTALMDGVGRATDAVRNRFEDQLMAIYLRGGRLGRAMKRLKQQLDVTPSGVELTDLYARQAWYDDAKARRLLGYAPRVTLDEGLAHSVAWLRQHMLEGATPPPCGDDALGPPCRTAREEAFA